MQSTGYIEHLVNVVPYVAEDGTDYFAEWQGETKMPVKEHRASDDLRTPQDIAAYLNAAIEEFEGDPRLLMKAFRNVAAAQGGVSEIARPAEVDRAGLSRSLSVNRDLRLGTVIKIASASGVRLRFVA